MVSTWSKTEIGQLYFSPSLILSLFKQENSESHTKSWVKINDLAKQHKSKIIAKLSAKSTDLIPSLSHANSFDLHNNPTKKLTLLLSPIAN